MISYETTINTDDSVRTEDRFALRKFIENLTFQINKQNWDYLTSKIEESFTADGFVDYPLFKKQFLNRFTKVFKEPDSFIRIPKLYASRSKFVFVLKGTYEEYGEGVLNTEGNLELSIAKLGDEFKIVKMQFYPRMLMKDIYE